MDNSFQTVELESQNPVAYPFLPPIIPQALSGDAYHQLTTPGRPSAAPASPQPLLRDSDPTASPISLCDSRLFQLNISHWTNVPISNEAAARAISLYLETDHPLLGYFDPNLFVSDLVNLKHDYCSTMLVNALLYWACQMYSAVDPSMDGHAAAFCTEAESIWETEREIDAIPNLAAALFLSLGYLGQGRDHAVLSYISQATKMAMRLGLFGVEDNGKARVKVDKMTAEAASAYLHAAWGSFNWIRMFCLRLYVSLMSLFYRQPGLEGPGSPPHLPIPGFEHDNGVDGTAGPGSPSLQPQFQYMGGVFPYICKFWSIMYEVSLTYGDTQSPLSGLGTLHFAEYKFRELLAWSNTLPSYLLRANQNPHYVQVLHFHKRFGDIRATFMADLDLAASDPGSATVEKQAGDFEHNAMLRDYTNILDED
ncbi:hypothetical protein CFAM422_010936 [Trichoderma lentiforme]|uniref:Transcription factor domain-containing protein n=1 Tax=Trichoderma lentiforme TaxID=1567552 RepID=A0A9P5C994_9HYPO|nr:hypothetical protein CFAM422_010936 [Trichoderma lentiforme]